jgi:hypothetical protein
MGADNARKLIREIYERGVRSFDLADLYGTHPLVPPALDGVPRDQYMLISKIWWRPGGIPEKERPDADVVVNRFLGELKTDYLDLVLLHCVEAANWPTVLEKQMAILASLRRRASFAPTAFLPFARRPQGRHRITWVDSVHSRINPYGIKMDGPADQVAPVLKQIRAKGKGVVGMKIIGEGELRNDEERKEKSIHFPFAQGLVDMVTVGFEKTTELDDFATRVKRTPTTA